MLKLSNELDLKRGEKIIALSNPSIYCTWKNLKSWYNNNKFKRSAPTWNDKFELPDELYSVSNMEDYFDYISEKYGQNVDNPSIQININNIENRVTFKIKKWICSWTSKPETMKLLGSTENKKTKDKNNNKAADLQITDVILVHCNIVINYYQQVSKILYTFVPNKPFSSLLEISPTNHVFLKTLNFSN